MEFFYGEANEKIPFFNGCLKKHPIIPIEALQKWLGEKSKHQP